MRIFAVVVTIFLSFFSTNIALAATSVSGTLSGYTAWTKVNSPYVVTGTLTIPADATLTIEPGTVVKMNGVFFVYIYGSLVAEGSTIDPIVITSFSDDTAGGDTNGDGGATMPLSGDWLALYFLDNAQGTFTHTDIRYGGRSNGPSNPTGQILNQGGGITITNSQLTDTPNYNVLQSSGTSTITDSMLSRALDSIRSTGGAIISTRNTFTDNTRPLFVSSGIVTLNANNFGSTGVASFVDASVNLINNGGNTGGRGLAVNGTISGNVTWKKDSMPYVITNTVTIPVGASLTIEPGTIVKMEGFFFFYIYGTLDAQGTALDPVTITSLRDDTIGGDTNGDGNATPPQPGDWLALYFFDNSHGTFTNVQIRYGGRSNGPTMPLGQIQNQGGGIAITKSVFAHSPKYNIEQSGGTTTITDSSITSAHTGIFVTGGTLSVHNSSISGNSEYGVRNTSTDTLDATHNWWGAFGGPAHPSNPFGSGDRVSDNVDFGNWLTAEPSALCTVDCNSNVLFLPGIMGSRLYDSMGNVRWLPEDDAEADNIRMNSNGTSVHPDITTIDAIDTADAQQAYTNIYKSFLAEMRMWEENYHITATTTPYDWRLDYGTVVNNGRKLPDGSISYLLSPAAGHDPYIFETLKQLASTSKTGKVTIIGHSQGGLIAKALMQKIGAIETARLIDKIIMVATPQLGTPKAVGVLLNGFDAGVLGAISNKKIRELAQYTPSAYNLLPSANYFTYVDDPVITISSSTLASWSSIYGERIRSEQGMHDFMSDASNLRTAPSYTDLKNPEIVGSTFLENARTTHSSLDTWTPPAGVQLVTIAGWGLSTLSGFEYYTVNKCVRVESIVILGRTTYYCAEYSPQITLKPNHVIDGDGTVVEPSALWAGGATSTRYWVNLDDYNSDNIDRDHKNILEVPNLRTLIKNIITSTSTQLIYLSTIAPQDTENGDRLHFTLHSPLTLGFTDTLGNYTGATATGTAFNIPDVYYERYGEVQWLSIPKALAGQVALHGTGSGSFTLDAEEVSGNSILSRTSFEGIPSSTSTIVTMNVISTQSVTGSSTLVIDFDGDTTPDFTLLAHLGASVTLPPPDLSPPEADISFSTSTQDLLVEGTDNIGTTTVTKDTSGNYTITDQAGHTTKLFFTKTYSGSRLTYAKLTGIQYDAAPKITLPTSSFLYVWDKKIPPTLVSQTIAVNNTYVITALYDKTRNKTTVVVLKKNVPVQTLTFVGLRIVKLTTNNGVVGYSL